MNKLSRFLLLLIAIGIGCLGYSRYPELFDRLLDSGSSVSLERGPQDTNKSNFPPNAEVMPEMIGQNTKLVAPYQLNIRPCQTYFKALDNLIIFFFQRKNFEEHIYILKQANLPETIELQLDDVLKSYNGAKNNIVKNEFVAKVISVEKIAIDSVKTQGFLDSIFQIQQYFYSPEFINICKQ
jgi:hypothetical protein